MSRLEPGDPAPDFFAKDHDGNEWSLENLRGRKVILYFYPADDTPGCTVEACDFRDAHADLSDAGYVVLGVSPQSAGSHRKFAEKHGLNFPLLVDDDLRIAKAYGAAADRPGVFDRIPLLVKRCTFVIDADGVIVEALYGVKARGHIAALRETLAV